MLVLFSEYRDGEESKGHNLMMWSSATVRWGKHSWGVSTHLGSCVFPAAALSIGPVTLDHEEKDVAVVPKGDAVKHGSHY